MGYYTRYTLNVKNVDNETMREIEKYAEEEGSWELNNVVNEDPDEIETMKWYEWHRDMKNISLKFPSALFILEGEGEESGDLWKCYFKNGKSQQCEAKITFDEFDESKLK